MKFLIIHDNPPGSRLVEASGLLRALHIFDETKAGDEYARAVANLTEGAPGLEAATLPPLFVPLDRPYFEAFERGDKTEEFRPYGPKWNEKTCPIGRRVVLSMGYGKARRLPGRIVSFRQDRHPFLLPGWLECYGDKVGVVAARIGIELEPNTQASQRGQ
jgi:hypothetical protein